MSRQVQLNVELTDILTDMSCSQLVIEFCKYIAYYRRQIPFPFKQLEDVVLEKDAKDQLSKELSSTNTVDGVKTIRIEEEFRKVKGIFESLQETFKHIRAEFQSEGEVQEVAVIFGATPLTPKDVYRLQFPTIHHGHIVSKHPPKQSLFQLFKCLFQSEDLHTMFSTNLAPTNLFFFIRKGGCLTSRHGFVPNERYILPSTGKHAVIQFKAPSAVQECFCRGFSIYSDHFDCLPNTVETKEENNVDREPLESHWFQSNHTVKGFKDIKLNGSSVSSFWLQPR